MASFIRKRGIYVIVGEATIYETAEVSRNKCSAENFGVFGCRIRFSKVGNYVAKISTARTVLLNSAFVSGENRS